MAELQARRGGTLQRWCAQKAPLGIFMQAPMSWQGQPVHWCGDGTISHTAVVLSC